jgi:hypothetical protein
MAGQRIDIGNDDWNVTFVKGDKEYRIDSLVYTSLLLEKHKGDAEPPREVVVDCMKQSMSDHEGLTEHEIWAMSVRLAKAMNKAGNA